MALVEHEWKCNGDVDVIRPDGVQDTHETVFLVTSATFGDEPTTPVCRECGRDMKKVYSIGAITYDRDWYMRR